MDTLIGTAKLNDADQQAWLQTCSLASPTCRKKASWTTSYRGIGRRNLQDWPHEPR
jgi:hypothetical protein